MDMTNETRLQMFRLGMEDKILEYFSTRGPMVRGAMASIMFADFSDGEDVNISTTTVVSLEELNHLRNPRDEAKVFHKQGRQAGEDLMEFLANSGRFEQHIRRQWWFRVYYRTKRIFQKAFALLRFWRYTWIVAIWRSFCPPKHLRGGW